jgi:putative DNA primase/helicase
LVQIIGRPRGVNRTASNPVDVLLMTNAPVPVPVERLISAADLNPSPTDTMMAAGGVAFDNPADAARAYPGLACAAERNRKPA